MFIEFTANASELHRACVRLTARTGETGVGEKRAIHFKVTSGRLGISTNGTSANLKAEAQCTGTALIPSTVFAGVLHILPYFGDRTVEIGLSKGKMRVDTTVFHTRDILLLSDNVERRRSLFRTKPLQTA